MIFTTMIYSLSTQGGRNALLGAVGLGIFCLRPHRKESGGLFFARLGLNLSVGFLFGASVLGRGGLPGEFADQDILYFGDDVARGDFIISGNRQEEGCL